jgi:acetyl esterase/lipase
MIGNLLAEWTIPKKAQNKVLLYFHGGGYVNGSNNTHKALVTQIVNNTDINALTIHYRRAPENPFPAALDDALATYQWLLAEGYLAQNIAIGGDSAGGGLTAALLYQIRDKDLPMPACAVMLCPWLDLTNSATSYTKNGPVEPILTHDSAEFWANAYTQGQDKKHPLISPLFGNPASLPPLYIQAAGKDILLDDAVQFAQKVKELGGNIKLDIEPEMFHVWNAFWLFLDEAKTANQQLGKFLMQHLG